jgi:predicted kinase
MPDRGEVVIVSGPPGSGKTTVSAALASGYELGVHLESDWFFRFILSGFVAPWLPDAHSQNAAVMVAAADAAAAYADAGYTVVWDGIVGPWFLGLVAQRLRTRKIRVQYLILRPRLITASQRVRGRGDTPETTGAETMYDQFADLGEFESHVVSSDAPLEQVIEACRAALIDGSLQVEPDSWSVQQGDSSSRLLCCPDRGVTASVFTCFVVYVAIVKLFLIIFLILQDIQRVIVTGCRYAYSHEICP